MMRNGGKSIADDEFEPQTDPMMPRKRRPVRQFRAAWANDIKPSLETNDFVEGLLNAASLICVYGESGACKTAVVTDLGLRISHGSPWCGRDVDRSAVVYQAGEGPIGHQNRIAAWRRHHAFDDADLALVAIQEQINLLDPGADVRALIRFIDAAADKAQLPVRLVTVDTLSRSLAGGNENASEDMGRLVMNCDRIRFETGAAVLLVHHAGKDTSKGARGHSLLRAATDTEIEVVRDEGSGIVTARVTKQRDMESSGEFSFTLSPVELGVNKRGKPVTSFVLLPTDAPARAKVGKRRPLPAEVLKAAEYLTDVLADHGAYQAAAGIPSTMRVVRLAQWRDQLKQRGLHSGDDAGRKWFERTKNKLIAENRIAIDGEFVWAIPGRV